MKKYGIIIECCDTDGYYYTDHIAKLFDTKEEAEKQIEKSLEDEWLSLISPLKPEEIDFTQENYYIAGNQIRYGYFEDVNDFANSEMCLYIISTYNIKEFEL